MQQHDERDEQQAEHEHRRGATARERKREATQDVDMGLSGQCQVYRPRLRLLRLPVTRAVCRPRRLLLSRPDTRNFVGPVLQAAPAAPEAAKGSAQLLPTPLSLGVIRRLAVRPERARWWRRLLRRSAHLQARRVVRVEAQDASTTTTARRPAAARCGPPGRTLARQGAAARRARPGPAGPLRQLTASRLPLTSLHTRRRRVAQADACVRGAALGCARQLRRVENGWMGSVGRRGV